MKLGKIDCLSEIKNNFLALNAKVQLHWYTSYIPNYTQPLYDKGQLIVILAPLHTFIFFSFT